MAERLSAEGYILKNMEEDNSGFALVGLRPVDRGEASSGASKIGYLYHEKVSNNELCKQYK